MKIKVYPKEFPQGRGYDVVILDETATVADYLLALNEFILAATNLKRTRLQGQAVSCEGCPSCCMERVPLTSVDFYQLGQGDVLEFVRDHCYVVVQGPIIDIMIAAQGQNLCHWLDATTNKCTVYLKRSLVCQTYICCPVSERAKLLRSIIVNTGEDELIRLWLVESYRHGLPVEFDEAEDVQVDLNHWQPNVFTNKQSYQEVVLRELLNDEEWRTLTKEQIDD